LRGRGRRGAFLAALTPPSASWRSPRTLSQGLLLPLNSQEVSDRWPADATLP